MYELQRAVRAIADTQQDVAYSAFTENLDEESARALKEGVELLRVLARLIEGKSVHDAFGAPGDWGYGTALGQALLAVYSLPRNGDAAISLRT